MPQSDISYLVETSPSVQAIRMRNAPWVIPFLFKAFKTENIISLPEPALIGLLAEELRHHAEGTEDLEAANSAKTKKAAPVNIFLTGSKNACCRISPTATPSSAIS